MADWFIEEKTILPLNSKASESDLGSWGNNEQEQRKKRKRERFFMQCPVLSELT
jgi:hypothetical protein